MNQLTSGNHQWSDGHWTAQGRRGANEATAKLPKKAEIINSVVQNYKLVVIGTLPTLTSTQVLSPAHIATNLLIQHYMPISSICVSTHIPQ